MSYFGLTGNVASGKSTAARMFEVLGAKIIDADRIGHEVLGSSLSAYQEIVHRFGDDILDSSGEIDRKKLGAMVFGDPAKLKDLNAIVHPKIIARVEELAKEHASTHPQEVILVDAALIFEAGIGANFRKVVVVWCQPEQQIERLMAKTGIPREAAQQRIASQMPADEKRRRADFLIDCSGSIEATRAQVESLYPTLQRLVIAK
jgi:dephospho-CoA kinase